MAASSEDSETWMSTDAFNLILLKQCEALIALGVDPALKEIVFILWMRYLIKCEKGFVSNKQDWFPKLATFNSVRDIQAIQKQPVRDMRIYWKGKSLFMENFSTKKKPEGRKRKLSKKTITHTNIKRKRGRPKLSEKSEKRQCLADPTSAETDENACVDQSQTNKENFVKNLTLAENSNETKDSNPDLLKNLSLILKKTNCYSKVALRVFKKCSRSSNNPRKAAIARKRYQVDSTNLRVVSSLCLIALRIMESPFLVSDFSRLVHEHRISYLETFKDLPPNWKLIRSDLGKFNIFSYPNLNKLYSGIRSIWRLLEINLPNSQLSLMSATLRFFLDLNLPHDLLPLLVKVVDKIKSIPPFNTRYFKIPEKFAAYGILVTLKMVFGLDGTTEKKLSAEAKEKNMAGTGDFFVWTDWEVQTRMLLQFMENFCPTSYSFSLEGCVDVDSLYCYIESAKIGRPAQGILQNKRTEIYNSSRISIRKGYSRIIEESNLKDNSPCPFSSFPLTSFSQKCADKLGVVFKDFSKLTVLPAQKEQKYWLRCHKVKIPQVSDSFDLVCRALAEDVHTYALNDVNFASVEYKLFQLPHYRIDEKEIENTILEAKQSLFPTRIFIQDLVSASDV